MQANETRGDHEEGEGRPEREGGAPERYGPAVPDEGAMVDEHGRAPGAPSRTGTGSSAPPADRARVERAQHTARGQDADREAPGR
ncbi:hypothetical protein [Streptomyces sp. NPDC091268]|uniref:hypothetical protein n=1 Tax=Streptomyces sp. NPDC091268 TaxID=3365979 RepID=UPI00381B490E